MDGGRTEIPHHRLLAAGEQREAAELVALPFADLGARDVANVVDVEEKQGAEEQAAKPEGEEEAQAAAPTPEEEKKKKLMQLLNSLDPGDTNLQLQQALEKMPETYIEKEW